jgi:ribose/xylose/arabinose/galactoside ABC-type transport system permease subunit
MVTYAGGFSEEPRFSGQPGFHEEPEFREVPTFTDSGPGFGGSGLGSGIGDTRQLDVPGGTPVSSSELEEVFDDPAHGDRGMDRMGVHIVWELMLFIGLAALLIVFRAQHQSALTGTAGHTLLLSTASLGFVALAVGLSLRAGAVNLAAGPIAVASAVFYATNAARHGTLTTISATVGLAVLAGLAIALVVVVLQVPAWAASLAAGLGLVTWIQHRASGPTAVQGSYHALPDVYYWFGAFAALAVLGAAVDTMKPLRRMLGRFRPVSDPADRRGGGAAIVVILALAVSGALAALGGVLTATSAPTIAVDDGALTTGLALGVALLGGTSAFGRRGGVFGTLLATALVTVFLDYGQRQNWRIATAAVAACTIAVGLLVTRLVEAFGRPGYDVGAEDAWLDQSTGRFGGLANGWGSPRPGGWSSGLPARSLDDTWGGVSDERWKSS